MTRTEVTLFLEEHRDEIIQMRLNGSECGEIAEKFGLNRSTVNSWLNRNGIIIRGKKTPENIKKIIHMYDVQRIPINKIAKELHFSTGTISEILKENNIKIRERTENNKIYTLNKHYFDEVDTPNKAYILGLLYADGNRSGSANTISLALQERDKHILEQINEEIGSNRPLRFIDYSHKPPRQNQYCLSVTNKHFAESLYKHGIVPCKEFKLDFPYWMRHDLIRHFIRGYLDGDGCIPKNPREKRVNFCGTKKVMTGIKKYVKEELGIHSYIMTRKGRNPASGSLGIAGGIQVKKFLDHIYEDAELYLIRKYKIYENIYLKNVNNSQST